MWRRRRRRLRTRRRLPAAPAQLGHLITARLRRRQRPRQAGRGSVPDGDGAGRRSLTPPLPAAVRDARARPGPLRSLGWLVDPLSYVLAGCGSFPQWLVGLAGGLRRFQPRTASSTLAACLPWTGRELALRRTEQAGQTARFRTKWKAKHPACREAKPEKFGPVGSLLIFIIWCLESFHVSS